MDKFILFVEKNSGLNEKKENSQSFFGTGPWPCLNPAHSKYQKSTINKVKMKRVRSGHLIGVFECSCGFVYSKRAENNPLNKIEKLEFGQVWKNRLKELVEQGLSLRSMGKQLQVTHSTIKRQISYLEKDCSEKKLYLETLRSKKEQWIELVNNNANVTVDTNYTLYQWLLRHDKVWLKENYPLTQKKNIWESRSRIDWEKRDIEILNEIKCIVKNWSVIEGAEPLKKTKQSIAKQTKSSYNIIIHNNREKLPQTLNYISSVVEDPYQYNLRKIRWAYNELGGKYENITIQEIVNKAGLSKNGWQLTKEFIYDVVRSSDS